MQKTVRTQRIIALDMKSAQALGDPVRVRILEGLGHKPMTAEELTSALENAGSKKAITTIRHHLDALRTAGLVEPSKMVEVRGALMKYYSPTIRAFSFESPAGLEEINGRLVQAASTKVSGILKTILADKKFQTAYAKGGHVCPFCRGNHFREFVAFEVLSLAIARVMEGEYKEAVPDREIRNAGRA